jgi:hypothetical protein
MLRMTENGMLRGMFGPEGDEETGNWRKLHNEQLDICALYQTHYY